MDFLEYVLLNSTVEIGSTDKDHISVLWTSFVKGAPTVVRATAMRFICTHNHHFLNDNTVTL